jgi:hypothetical protein
LYDKILDEQIGMDEAKRNELKERREEARKRDHQYFFELLQDSTKEEFNELK